MVAIATIGGWIFNDPIDVAGPARSAVNRTALVGSYAQDCVTRWLTATASHQQTLHDCWSLHDQMRLPTTPAVIVASPAVSASATSGKASGAHGGLTPISSWMERLKSSSVKVSIPQSVW